jgi:hypothetical protein
MPPRRAAQTSIRAFLNEAEPQHHPSALAAAAHGLDKPRSPPRRRRTFKLPDGSDDAALSSDEDFALPLDRRRPRPAPSVSSWVGNDRGPHTCFLR